ncbi:MAG: DUF6166 domain-containing protein [Acidimicrobiia bacterium]
MSTAIVAGPAGRTGAVADALRSVGFETVRLDGDSQMSDTAGRVSPRSVDCYVQMPHQGTGTGAGARPGWATVAAQINEVARAAPLLADGALVVVVADGWDERLVDAFGVLADAALAEGTEGRTRISVLPPGSSPEAVLHAVRPGAASPDALDLLVDVAPDLGFAEWRTRVMGITGTGTRSYFGWSRADGNRRAGVLAGAVLSPLRGTGNTDTQLSWGEIGTGTDALAECILADALGDKRLPGELHSAFAKEIIGNLAADGFELSAREVVAWARRHLADEFVLDDA